MEISEGIIIKNSYDGIELITTKNYHDFKNYFSDISNHNKCIKAITKFYKDEGDATIKYSIAFNKTLYKLRENDIIFWSYVKDGDSSLRVNFYSDGTFSFFPMVTEVEYKRSKETFERLINKTWEEFSEDPYDSSSFNKDILFNDVMNYVKNLFNF